MGRRRRVQFHARAVARVDEVLFFQPREHPAVCLRPQTLRRLFLVPGKTQPLEIALELVCIFPSAPVRVQILDAKHELSAAASDRQPRKHCRKYVSQMHSAAGAWRKAPDLFHCDPPFCPPHLAAGTEHRALLHRKTMQKCPGALVCAWAWALLLIRRIAVGIPRNSARRYRISFPSRC